MRWTEEIELLAEERARVLRFCQSASSVWDLRALHIFGHDTAVITEGRAAYAKRQAEMFRIIGGRCTKAWADIDAYISQFGDSFDDANGVNLE